MQEGCDRCMRRALHLGGAVLVRFRFVDLERLDKLAVIERPLALVNEARRQQRVDLEVHDRSRVTQSV